MTDAPTPGWRGTTILAVKKGERTVIAGDGQVTMGATIVKANARKVRRLAGGKVVAGFAGATADAFTLLERLEQKLEAHPEQFARACVELAKDWRTDRYLRRLDAMMIAADASSVFTITGAGDVLEPEAGIAARATRIARTRHPRFLQTAASAPSLTAPASARAWSNCLCAPCPPRPDAPASRHAAHGRGVCNDRPSGVISYSTATGEAGITRRDTSPLRSSRRTHCVRAFCVTPSR